MTPDTNADSAHNSVADQGTEERRPWLHGGDLVAGQLAVEGLRHLFRLTGGHISAVAL